MPNRTELMQLADECCAGQKRKGLVMDVTKAICPLNVEDFESVVDDALNYESWDAFVALLPEGWDWRRDEVSVSVWPWAATDLDNKWIKVENDGEDFYDQPRHGVAAILRAMASTMEAE